MAFGPWQILIVVILIVLLFGGKGKISSIMGDMGKGITSFRKGLKDGIEDETETSTETNDETLAKDTIDVTPPKHKKKTK